jgi:HEAT repeat protein
MRPVLHLTVATAVFVVGICVSPTQAQQQPNTKPPGGGQQDVKELAKPKEISSGTVIGGKTLGDWMNDLKDKDPAVRENGLATLKIYGTAAREAAPLIIKLLRDGDTSVRVNAAIALGLIGMDDINMREGISGLARLLADGQLVVRYQAAMALGRLGPDARDAIPNLIPVVRPDGYASGHCWEIRKAACFALGSVAADKENGPDSRAIGALIGAFNDSCHQVRLEAVIAILVLGAPATGREKIAINNALRPLAKDRNKHVQIWASMALMRMDKVIEENLALIAKHLKATEASVRQHSARALGTVGPEASSCVPNLVDALQHEEDPQTLLWIVWGLVQVQIKEPSPRAVSALTGLLKHKLDPIRHAAQEALEMLKGKNRKEESLPGR